MNGLREPTTHVENGERNRVLIVPAKSEAEHIAAELLTMSLDPSHWEVQVTSDDTLASELLDQVEQFRPSVILVATLPPGGISHTRYLMTRLRQRFGSVRLIIGRWGCVEGIREDATAEAFANVEGVDYAVAETRKRLMEMRSTLRITDVDKARERNGTALAK